MKHKLKILPGTRKAHYLSGVKYWQQRYPIGHEPRFELYRFIGEQKESGLYFFESAYYPGVMISKYMYQLNAFGFQPYMIDTEELKRYLVENGIEPPPLPA